MNTKSAIFVVLVAFMCVGTMFVTTVPINDSAKTFSRELEMQDNPKPQSTGPVQVSGRQILVNGEPFFIRGVGYAPTPIGWSFYDFYNDSDIYQRDFPLLRAMGCNTIRTWSEVTSTAFLDAAYNEGSNPIYVVMGFWIEGTLDLSDPAVRANYIDGFKTYVETYKDHPAVLMWCVGNEVNMLFLNNNNKLRDWYTLLNELAEAAYEVEGSIYHPVATANYELYQIGDSSVSADDASMDYLDAWGSNAYLGLSFGTLFSDYASKSSKPFFITEYGIDAWDHVHGREYEDRQAEYAGALWDEMVANSAIASGGTIMAYSDEWWKAAGELDSHDYGGYSIAAHPDGFSNEEWWGIMRTIDNGSGPDIMEPRQAYYTLLAKWGGPPQNDPPTLTSGGVNPPSGNVATILTYEVTYTDANNDAPSYIKIYIDGESHEMLEADPNDVAYADGKEYKYSTTLAAGNHDYHFEVSDGTNAVRLPVSGECSGPSLYEGTGPEESESIEGWVVPIIAAIGIISILVVRRKLHKR